MRRFSGLGSLLVAALVLMLACRPAPKKPRPQGDRRQAQTTSPRDLKTLCYRAKLWAMDQEMQRYRTWIQNAQDDQKRLEYRRALARLQVERERLQSMPPESLRLPRDSVVVLVTIPPEGCSLGMVLPYEGLSRSGPFYVVAGPPPGGCPVLQPGHRYRLVLRPVLPQNYPFPSSYVCIVAYREVPAEP